MAVNKQMIGYLALAIGILLTLRIILLIDNPRRDFTENHAQFSEQAADPLLRPPVVSGSVDEVARRLRDWIAEQPRWEEVRGGGLDSEASAQSSRQMHLTRTTPLMRFTDDIQITLTPLPSEETGPQVRVDAESQSRVGKGDLGQNPRNLKELRQAF